MKYDENSMITPLDLLWPKTRDHVMPSLCPLRWNAGQLQKHDIHHIDLLVAAGAYRDPALRSLIRRMKFGSHRSMAPIIAQYMVSAIPGLLTDISPAPLIVPVPLHWSRFLLRGMNQSELLARHIACHMHWPTASPLARARPTGYQSHRVRSDRKAGVAGAFRWKTGTEISRHVLLIDDICTTGATLDACAKVLKTVGVERVSALVAAHG